MKKSTLKWLFLIPAALYLYMVIKLTFLKDGIRLETNVYRMMPFNSVYEYKQGLKSAASLIMNYAGNIAMFFPVGIFLPVFFKKLNFWKTVLIGLLFSLLIELLQYTMSSGYADVDDIIMNTLGAALGAFTFFCIFMGKKRSKVSYILSLVLILLLEVGSCVCIWRFAPNLLPESAISINGMIAGRSVDDYDIFVKCYKMSHGDVFVIKNTAEDNSGNKIEKKGSYSISDRAVFVTADEDMSYHIEGIDEMIESVAEAASETGEAYLKLWLSEDGKCEMILLEK